MAELVLKFKPVVEGQIEGKVEKREMSEFLGYDEGYNVLVYKDEDGKTHNVNANMLEEVVFPKEMPGHSHGNEHHNH